MRTLWKLNAAAPLLAWAAAALAPPLYAAWVVWQSSDLNIEALDRQVRQATGEAQALQRQAEALEKDGAGAPSSAAASAEDLDRLLRFRCALRRGYEIQETSQGSASVSFSGPSAFAFCALNALTAFPGGLSALRVGAGAQVQFQWDGADS